MVGEIREAARSAAGALRDAAIWSALARSVFSWTALGIVLGGLVVALLLGFVGLLLPHGFAWLLGLPLSIWISPHIVRRVCCEVTQRSLAPLARATGVTAKAWPAIHDVRAWWLPVVVVTALPLGDWATQLGLMLPYELVQVSLSPKAMTVVIFSLSVILATRPLARTALAPWFDAAQVDAAIARGRWSWRGLIATCVLLAGALQAGVHAVLMACGFDQLVWQPAGLTLGRLLTLGFAAWLLALLAQFIVVVPALAAFAWLGARRVVGDALRLAPSKAPGDAPPQRAPISWKAATVMVAVAACLLWSVRAQLIIPLLGADFRARVAAAGSWDNPMTRQHVHTELACDGRDSNLRMLHWAGVTSDGSPFDGALACAITEGHASTVGLLLPARADMARPLRHPRLSRGPQPLELAPIGWAMQSPRALAMAPLLVARGASLAHAGSTPDAVQAASTAHCLPCLEWLAGQGAAFTATAPSTPMTLWIEASQTGASAAEELERLGALGISATAIGSDGRTPLLVAASQADAASVTWLLAHGADPAIADGQRMTPLDRAAQGSGVAAAGPGSQAERDAITLQLLELTPPRGPDTAGVGDHYVRGAAEHSADIFMTAHRRGWPLERYDAWFLDAMAPDAARAFIAGLDDATVAALLPVRSEFIGIAASHGWWNELARAARGWASGVDSIYPSSRSCQVVERGVLGALDDSPKAAVSWSVVEAARNAGMQFDRCDRERIAQGLAGRGATQQAQWAQWAESDALVASTKRH